MTLQLPQPSPFRSLTRAQWKRRRAETPLTLTDEDLDRLRGVNEPISLREVTDIYLPLSRLLSLHVRAVQDLQVEVVACAQADDQRAGVDLEGDPLNEERVAEHLRVLHLFEDARPPPADILQGDRRCNLERRLVLDVHRGLHHRHDRRKCRGVRRSSRCRSSAWPRLWL